MFETNLGRTFEAGKPHNLYVFPADNSYLAGFHGAQSGEIDRLGLILIKPFKSGAITNITWPAIDAETGDLKKESKVFNLCNDSDKQNSEEVEVQHQEGSRQSMMFDTAFKIGNEVPVHAKLPELVEDNGKLAWKLSNTKLTSVDADTIKVQTEKVPLTVSPMTQVKSEVEWTQGVISALPVHVDYSVTFEDDSIHTFKLEGF